MCSETVVRSGVFIGGKPGFPAGETRRAFAQPGALCEGMEDGRWVQTQLEFYKCINQPFSL